MKPGINRAELEEIEALLPWHAAGTLDVEEAERVEAALARDPELARQFELVREEFAETIHLNETLGAPSIRAMERLMAGIDAEIAAAPKPRESLVSGFASWLSAQFALRSPRTLAWSAGAAALAIVLQVGLLAGLYVNVNAPSEGGGGKFTTASYTAGPDLVSAGSYAKVIFVPHATMADITKFLNTHKASVVEGPNGSVYTVRLSSDALAKEDVSRIMKGMEAETEVVRYVLPGN
jgi:hypothetical protein